MTRKERAERRWLEAVEAAKAPRKGMKLATLAVVRDRATEALQAELAALKRRSA